MRDARTGDMVPSKRPGTITWSAFFALMDTIDVPADFMGHRPLNVMPRECDQFGTET